MPLKADPLKTELRHTKVNFSRIICNTKLGDVQINKNKNRKEERMVRNFTCS